MHSNLNIWTKRYEERRKEMAFTIQYDAIAAWTELYVDAASVMRFIYQLIVVGGAALSHAVGSSLTRTAGRQPFKL